MSELQELQKQTHILARREARHAMAAGIGIGFLSGVALVLLVPSPATVLLPLALPLAGGAIGYRSAMRRLT